MLEYMIQKSNYSKEARRTHLEHFGRLICFSLGTHPEGSTKSTWQSCMNDDYTPVEFSWSWTASNQFPTVRYAVEPIGKLTGAVCDPYNIAATNDLMKQLRVQAPRLDLSWFHYFNNLFSPESCNGEFTTKENTGSSRFIAVEPKGDGSISAKAYFIPQGDKSNKLSVIANAIRSLPGADSRLTDCVKHLSSFLSEYGIGPVPWAEMLGIDCTHPSRARLKIYIRTEQTSFDSVLGMMMFPKNQLSAKETAKLRDFWYTILGLEDSGNDSDSLPTNNHWTAGIIYHFDLRLNSSVPKIKVYIPVKHYGINDLVAAERFSKWLENNGRKLHDSTYLDAVQSLCGHRALEEDLGFQTYFSAALDGGELAVTAYLQPETYHSRRQKSV
ncbi:aromatic prenyltransferase [Massariosphaeria phaeospora]|uniref:Aromatic prenyltransferase n=1 Tax=Massariosphaeria phaeospora TaxID=100035 RepID=A0A7C8MDP6_9PLEO|nr:aromatic prenyltransferase [Massariosphaeria phaeospora]